MRKLLILILPLLVACAGEQPGALRRTAPRRAGMDPVKLSRVDSVIRSSIAGGNMSGAVLSVVRGDRIVYLKAYGNRQVVPDTVAMTPETVFDLASLSKCVGTTLSFLQLVEQGQVRLTDPVRRYIPDFQPWTDPETGEGPGGPFRGELPGLHDALHRDGSPAQLPPGDGLHVQLPELRNAPADPGRDYR